MYFFFFFFNDTATTEIYTLSLHDALPIYFQQRLFDQVDQHVVHAVGLFAVEIAEIPLQAFTHALFDVLVAHTVIPAGSPNSALVAPASRSEEHTSELQSPCNLVCRLLLEKQTII